jgi:hypothetical protein
MLLICWRNRCSFILFHYRVSRITSAKIYIVIECALISTNFRGYNPRHPSRGCNLLLRGCSELDADTQEGIQKVKIGIEMANEDGKSAKAGADLMKNVKFTSLKGNFDIRTMPEGRYLLTVSKLGYITQVISVNVVSGEMCRVAVNLVKE